MQAAMGASLLTILVATVAAWLFGAAWYGILGKQWMAAANLSEEKIKGPSGRPSPVPFILSFILEFVMAYVLAVLFLHITGEGLALGTALSAAFFVWLGFIATTLTINHRYGMQKWSLTVIDGGHWLGVLLVMAAVMTVMGL